jgi:hypothetical protein
MKNTENPQIDWQNVAADNFVKITKLEAQHDADKATIRALVKILESVTASAEAMNRSLTMLCAESPETELLITEARAVMNSAKES